MTLKDYVVNDYEAALSQLMRLHMNKGALIKTLQRGPTKYNVDKLIHELQKRSFVPPEEKITTGGLDGKKVFMVVKENIEAIRTETEKRIEVVLSDDPVLKQLQSELVGLFKKASFIHATKLDDDSLSHEEIESACLEILDIYKNQIPAIDTKVAYYKEHGMLPEEKKVDPPVVVEDDALKLYKRIETLKKNISRDKKSRPEKVAEWENELKEKKAILDALQKQGNKAV